VKAKKTSAQLAAGRELIYYDEHPSADRQIQDTRALGRTTVRSEIRYDPVLGEWVVLASHRQGRTHLPPAELRHLCPSTTTHYTLRHAASGRQCVSVAVADRPEGPFRDTRSRPLVCQERLGGSIDSHRFVDPAGPAYLVWKNGGNCCGPPTRLWAQRLDGDGLELIGEPASLGVRNDSPDYAVGYATASRVLGPYRDGPGNPILRSRGKAAGPTEGPQEAP